VIINGGSRSNGRFFAKHLTNTEENERVTLCEVRNLAAESVAEAFREMEGIALGTQCKNYFYHANINPLDTEQLTQEQWNQAIDMLEANLGLQGHARFVVEHQKKSRTHRHIIWLRIDVESMRAVKMTDDYEQHQATARQLEKSFRLKRGRSVLGPHKAKGLRPVRRPKPWESFRGRKSGIDPQAMQEQISSLYRRSRNAEEFMHALKEHHWQLVRGDRQDFCVVDIAGHVHSLAKRLAGIAAGELSQFMRSVASKTLPSLKNIRQLEYRR
jgi:hypothetical protein